MLWGFWPRSMWDLSSPTRDRTHNPCTGEWSLNHWTTWKSPCLSFLIYKRVRNLFHRVMERIKWNILIKDFNSVLSLPLLHNTDLLQLLSSSSSSSLRTTSLQIYSCLSYPIGMVSWASVLSPLPFSHFIPLPLHLLLLNPTMTISDEPNGFSSMLSLFKLCSIHKSGIHSVSDFLLLIPASLFSFLLPNLLWWLFFYSLLKIKADCVCSPLTVIFVYPTLSLATPSTFST